MSNLPAMPPIQRLILFVSCAVAFGCGFLRADELRLNEIQVIGTHNSYRQTPHPALLKLIEATSKEVAQTLEYSHRPLPEQFSDFGIRQIELDMFYDPQGGLFASPRGLAVAKLAGASDIAPYDPDGAMKKPGLKVMHVQDVDYVSTVPTFALALQTIKAWSDANPRHVPIMILVELKQGRPAPVLTKPIPFDSAALDSIDEEIRNVFTEPRIITPDWVRGEHASLRAAISVSGWPALDRCRGKVIFAMDNPGQLPRDYLAGHANLEGRAMFVDLGPKHPAGVFRKLNNPVTQFDQIQAAVKSGYLVRTRADADTREARANDFSRAQKALSSGAHFVSTDFPYPDETKSPYQVRLPQQAVFRPNPLLVPAAGSIGR